MLNVIIPNKEKHSEEIYDLLDLWRASNSQMWRQGRRAQSHFDWNTSRLTCIDQQMVEVFGIYDISMRIGQARVRVAGQNLDVTHSQHGDNWPQLTSEAAQHHSGPREKTNTIYLSP
ncbi:TPA: hypothetical protein EYG59_25890 [Candidatus Poribacteria bacterium]|nr:hypothetical protein [Candidatus Poribacteria bacterium]